MKLGDWFSRTWFSLIHCHNLVYNTCWEDPRLDRQALNLGPEDIVLVITSAGCNALDYALLGPRHIHAVDINPRQNALLELKLAGIHHLDYDTFFALFGRGRLRTWRTVYQEQLRPALSFKARAYWDRRLEWFSGEGRRPSFYYYGTAGTLAWLIRFYIDHVAKVRAPLNTLLAAPSLAEQRRIYDEQLRDVFWTRLMRWTMDRDTTLSLLGVPRVQRQQVERSYPGGVVQFIQDRVETVFTQLPLYDNYFWRVYLTGQYTEDCCPEYLSRDGFARLKAGLAQRVTTHSCSILEFLRRHRGRISRFVLLDHMDWLSAGHNQILGEQWGAIIERAARGARLLWRSGGLKVDYVDPIEVRLRGRRQRLGDLLTYQHDLAAHLHARDRVHTYGSFYVADLAA
jgi:S-adenosylmethionine-diacylglycerol 3-amino-3-carboxypropyl transferase